VSEKDALDLDRQHGQLICSVGLEFRDYPTLIKAMSELDVEAMIAAASPWSKRADSTAGQEIPANITVSRFNQYDLRTLYEESSFVVMPLVENNFQAGVTTILEAMAMGKANICSQTQGQTDVIVDGQSGLYVPPEDLQALGDGIAQLMANSAEAEEMGRRGRQKILDEMSLDRYVERLNIYVQQARQS
jgi:glycosyltransferase involved in cell wall biosynthesis